MPYHVSHFPRSSSVGVPNRSTNSWPTFEQILQRLHAEGILIHSDQLAEFLLAHGLPVHLRYVPAHLQQKARRLNEHYQGDMAKLVEEVDEQF